MLASLFSSAILTFQVVLSKPSPVGLCFVYIVHRYYCMLCFDVLMRQEMSNAQAKPAKKTDKKVDNAEFEIFKKVSANVLWGNLTCL